MLLISTLTAAAQDIPEASKTLVTDLSGTLNAAQIQTLEHKLLAFEDSTSNQIAVVLVRTTEGYDIADYAVRLAKKWGVGGKQHNNGIVLLAAIDDRAVTIQTGYGLEGAMPDVIAYRIIQNEIKPAFGQGDYYGGISRATEALMAYTKGEYKADPRQPESPSRGVPSILIIIVVVVIIAFISKKGGGGKNGGGRVMNGKGASDLFWWTLINSMGRGGGGGFGGGDGGGFGGFGGGDFGGGGASGRW